MREPFAAGYFYPAGRKELKAVIRDFLSTAKVSKGRWVAAISPHAGYAYCGRVMASVYGSLPEFETAVIIGPSHSGEGTVSVSDEPWRTPLGPAEVDRELAEALGFKVDPAPHAREHSVEVQVPWIQYLFPDAKILPVVLNPGVFSELSIPLGRKIAECAEVSGRKVVVVASSDFSHIGAAYGMPIYSPERELRAAEETDRKVVEAAVNLEPERVLELGSGTTACGYGCAASASEFARKTGASGGRILDRATSFEVSGDLSAVVFYWGAVMG